MDIWAYSSHLDSAPKRLTFDPGYDGAAVWSPDGRQLLFSSNRLLNLDLYIKNADGLQEEQNILQDDFDKLSNHWSRDGKYILYRHADDLSYLTLPDAIFSGKALGLSATASFHRMENGSPTIPMKPGNGKFM